MKAPQHNLIVVAILAGGIAWGGSSAAIAQGQAPPLCTDEYELSKVKEQYEIAESFGSGLKVEAIQDIRQTALGPSRADVLTFGAAHYGVNSRYCEGRAVLSNGEEDTVFWRMDYVTGGEKDYVTHATCFLRHDAHEEKCERARQPTAADAAEQETGARHSAEPAARPGGAASETIVVNAPDGPTPQTRAALQRARETGAASVTLKLENVGLIQDEELMQLIMEELRGIVAEYGFPDDSLTFIQCSEACEQ